MAPQSSASLREAPYVYPLQVLGLAVAYATSGWLGLQCSFHQQEATLLWPPTGIALAALLIGGARLWIGVWLGAFAVSLIDGLPGSVSMAIATGDTLMPLAGALLMVRIGDFQPTLPRVRDVIVLGLVGGALAATIGAGIGVAALRVAGIVHASDMGSVLSIWWRRDLLGVVSFAPLLLLAQGDGAAWRHLFRDTHFWMMAGLALAVVVLGYSTILPTSWEPIPVRLVIPFLLWVAVSLGLRASALLYVGILVSSVMATSHGLGPIFRYEPADRAEIQFWLYLMISGFIPLCIAAVIQQRDEARAQQKLEAMEKSRIERGQFVAAERDRILREMHDGIGGQLTSILSMVRRGAATNEDIGEALHRTLDDMRIMIDALEASDIGLPEMIGRLRSRLEPVLRRNGLRASWTIEGLDALVDIDPSRALHVLRIIQESIANVVQHAQASVVEIRAFAMDATAQIVAIEIVDDGVGSDPDSTGKGRGIRNMKARAQALGADLRFENRESGYAVRLLMPVSDAD